MAWNHLGSSLTWNNAVGTNGGAAAAAAAAAAAEAGKTAATTAAKTAAESAKQAAMQKYVYTPTRYASLAKIQYPPPAPPLVQLTIAAADLAVASANKARGAKSLEAAQQAAGETAVATAAAVRKGAGTSEDASAKTAVARAKTAMGDAAKALSAWTKQDPKKLADGLIAQADALLAQQTEDQVTTKQDVVATAVSELPAAAIRLDWRFWTGLAAAGVGVVLLARRD
jgi:hypothetical protein